jgi:hypothetical protein
MFAMRTFDLFATICFVALKKLTTTRASNFKFSHNGEASVRLRQDRRVSLIPFNNNESFPSQRDKTAILTQFGLGQVAAEPSCEDARSIEISNYLPAKTAERMELVPLLRNDPFLQLFSKSQMRTKMSHL